MDTPLQLEEYFFPHVKVSADPEAVGPDGTAKCDFGINVNSIKTADETGSFQVSLVISSSPESEKQRIPYSIELAVIGFFRVSPDWPDPHKLLEINGASILYAAAREFIITITSRGPWGAFMLPTASFLKIYTQKYAVKTEELNNPREVKNPKPKKRQKKRD
jgi:preprotein translocase subunit SecB